MKQHVVPVCYTPLAINELNKFKNDVKNAVAESTSKLAAAEQELSELTSKLAAGSVPEAKPTEAEAKVAAAKAKVERNAELAKLALQLPSFENHPYVVTQTFQENYNKQGGVKEGDVVKYVFACEKMRDSQELSATSWAHAVNNFIKPSDYVPPIDCSQLSDTAAIDAHYMKYRRAVEQAIATINIDGSRLSMSRFSELPAGKKAVYETKERDILFSSISIDYEEHMQRICDNVREALGDKCADFSGAFEAAIRGYVESPTIDDPDAHRLYDAKLNSHFPSDLDRLEAIDASTRLKDFICEYNLTTEDKIYEQLLEDHKSTISDKKNEISAQEEAISTAKAQFELQAAKLKAEGIETRKTIANKSSSKAQKDKAQLAFDFVNQEHGEAKQSLVAHKELLGRLKAQQLDFNKKLRSDAEIQVFKLGQSYSPLTKGFIETLSLTEMAHDPAKYLKQSLIRFCHSSAFIHDELKETQTDRLKGDLEFTGVNPIKNRSQVVFYRLLPSNEVDAEKKAATFAAAESGAAAQDNSLHFHIAITKDKVAVYCKDQECMFFEAPEEIGVFRESERFFKSTTATQRKLCYKDKQLIKSETMFKIHALIDQRRADMIEGQELSAGSTDTHTGSGSDDDPSIKSAQSDSSSDSDSSHSSHSSHSQSSGSGHSGRSGRSGRSRHSRRSNKIRDIERSMLAMQNTIKSIMLAILVAPKDGPVNEVKWQLMLKHAEDDVRQHAQDVLQHSQDESKCAAGGMGCAGTTAEDSPSVMEEAATAAAITARPPVAWHPVAGSRDPLPHRDLFTVVNGSRHMRPSSAPPAPMQSL